MMGGYADRIPAYIAGGYYEEGKGWDMLQSEMKENLKRGAKAVKMKIGGASIKEDLETRGTRYGMRLGRIYIYW